MNVKDRFFTAVAAEPSSAQLVVREFSETPSTSVALTEHDKYDLKSIIEKQMGRVLQRFQEKLQAQLCSSMPS